MHQSDHTAKCYLFIRHSVAEKTCFRLQILLKKKGDKLFLKVTMDLKIHGNKIWSSLLRLLVNTTQLHESYSTIKNLWTVRLSEEMHTHYHGYFQ